MERLDFVFGGLSNSLAETAESRNNAWLTMNTQTDGGELAGHHRYTQIGARSGAHSGDVGWGLGYGSTTNDETQVLRMTGNPTSGTFKLQFDGKASEAALGQDTATIAYNCTADDVYSALEALAGITSNDVHCTGGPFPALPIEITFLGQYAGTDMRILVLDTNSLSGGTTPTVSISEKRKGGTSEVFYAVVQHNGDTDSNLYAITSTDDWETTTWTSLASDLDSSDWFFQQYEDRMFFSNAADGLKYVFIGSTAILGNKPAAPTSAPTAADTAIGFNSTFPWSGGSTSTSGFGSAPTITLNSYNIQLLTTGAETGRDVSVTVTLAADYDMSRRDWWMMEFALPGDVAISPESVQVEYINADGTPVTIRPPLVGNPVGTWSSTSDHFGKRFFHFIDEGRRYRENIDKIKISWRFGTCATGKTIYITAYHGWTFINDDRSLQADSTNSWWIAEKDRIEYCTSNYDVAGNIESDLSPILKTPPAPNNQFYGAEMTVYGTTSSTLSSSDLVFFYRKEKSTGKWRRLPNKADWVYTSDFGDTNTGTVSIRDGWMEHELEDFPEPNAVGFPPVSTGAKAEMLGAWKQSLVVGSGKLAYCSWVGDPTRFEPPPNTPNYVSPDPNDYPDVGVTEFVSDDRSEDVRGIVGQDNLYVVTPLSAYAKIGDSPAESSVFRRLPGSRGAVGKRASCRWGAGVTIASHDGLWHYLVGRGLSGGDNGVLTEREETGPQEQRGGVRTSYNRLISGIYSVAFSGTVTGGTYSVTIEGQTATIPYNFKPYEVLALLEALSTVGDGDVEVFGGDPSAGGTMYIRLMGQYAGNVATISLNGASLTGGGSASLTTIAEGGISSVVLTEFRDEYWVFNGKRYLFQSRNRTWHEGLMADSVKAVVSHRAVGFIFLTSTGKLMRIGDGYVTDAGTAVRWYYESPWMIGPRLSIKSVRAIVKGAPEMRIITDDGANGITVTDLDLSESRFTVLNSSTLPGVKYKLIFQGVSGTDSIQKLSMDMQGEGAEFGT